MSASTKTSPAEGAPLKIGEVAKLAGTTPRTIPLYEEIGLLPASGGLDPGAHRTFSQSDVDRLIEVMRLRTLLGVSLDGLKELVEAEDNREALKSEWPEGRAAPVRPREILESLDDHAERQLKMVRARRDEIAALEAELLERRARIGRRARELDDEPATA